MKKADDYLKESGLKEYYFGNKIKKRHSKDFSLQYLANRREYVDKYSKKVEILVILIFAFIILIGSGVIPNTFVGLGGLLIFLGLGGFLLLAFNAPILLENPSNQVQMVLLGRRFYKGIFYFLFLVFIALGIAMIVLS
jgi:hypothetical protein